MPDRRRLPGSGDTPNKHDVGRWFAGNATRILFFGLFVLFGLASVTAASPVLAIVAALFFGQFVYVILPIHSMREKSHRLMTGEAGEEAYDETVSRAERLRRWLP